MGNIPQYTPIYPYIPMHKFYVPLYTPIYPYVPIYIHMDPYIPIFTFIYTHIYPYIPLINSINFIELGLFGSMLLALPLVPGPHVSTGRIQISGCPPLALIQL